MRNIERPLVDLSRSRDVRAFTLFAATAAQLKADQLAELYDREKALAPRRSSVGKKFFVGHSGFPSTEGDTNRDEEHLAIAIYNEHHSRGRGLVLPTGEELLVLDYQFPLKAKQNDRGVGKVDLFAVTSSGQACVVELKVGIGHYPDAPLRGLIEALAYAAIVEANLDCIAEEVRDRLRIHLSSEIPRVILAAPTSYWDAFRSGQVDANWSDHLLSLAGKVRAGTGVEVSFLELLGASFKHGSSSVRPRLLGRIHCRAALAGGSAN